MSYAILPKVIGVAALLLAIGSRPVLAQRGGHAGAGGFHGGGAHFAAGAHSYAGAPRAAYGPRGSYVYHGAQHAVRGGYHYGRHPAYWGYPRYGHGYGYGYGYGYGGGFAVGFGWPYYWTYAYPYGYWWGGPYPYYYPYYSPYSPPPVSVYPDDSEQDPPGPKASPQRPAPEPGDNLSPKDSDTPTRQGSPQNDYVGTEARGVERISTLQIAGQTVRPELLRAVEALREMPPYAREREIDHGRYSSFSAEEKAFLKSLDQVRKGQPAPPKPQLQ